MIEDHGFRIAVVPRCPKAVESEGIPASEHFRQECRIHGEKFQIDDHGVSASLLKNEGKDLPGKGQQSISKIDYMHSMEQIEAFRYLLILRKR